jgi:two-component system, OmpR family, response regulator
MYITDANLARGYNRSAQKGSKPDANQDGWIKLMGPGKHILVVDDNEAVREVIASMLQEHHYCVSTASDGSEMRDFLETGDMVDCIILDALMPGEATPSLLLHLRQQNIPVVVISGSPDALEHVTDDGLQFLQKPFRSQELCSAVNTALAGERK